MRATCMVAAHDVDRRSVDLRDRPGDHDGRAFPRAACTLECMYMYAGWAWPECEGSAPHNLEEGLRSEQGAGGV